MSSYTKGWAEYHSYFTTECTYGRSPLSYDEWYTLHAAPQRAPATDAPLPDMVEAFGDMAKSHIETVADTARDWNTANATDAATDVLSYEAVFRNWENTSAYLRKVEAKLDEETKRAERAEAALVEYRDGDKVLISRADYNALHVLANDAGMPGVESAPLADVLAHLIARLAENKRLREVAEFFLNSGWRRVYIGHAMMKAEIVVEDATLEKLRAALKSEGGAG